MGFQVVPPLVVFQTPPLPTATYQVPGSLGRHGDVGDTPGHERRAEAAPFQTGQGGGAEGGGVFLVFRVGSRRRGGGQQAQGHEREQERRNGPGLADRHGTSPWLGGGPTASPPGDLTTSGRRRRLAIRQLPAIIAYVCWRPHDGDAQLIPEAVMRSIVAVLILATACLATAAVAAPLSVETYTLPNGLTVILHEDHALPR